MMKYYLYLTTVLLVFSFNSANAARQIEILGYPCELTTPNSFWGKVDTYLIPYDDKTITFDVDMTISRLRFSDEDNNTLMNYEGRGGYDINMSNVPFGQNCFLYVKTTSVSGSNYDNICYIRRFSKIQPTHKPVNVSLSSPSYKSWERSRDNGVTWETISDSNKGVITEIAETQGEVLYRVLAEDGTYSQMLKMEYYDNVPSAIATSPAAQTKTVDENVSFTLDIEDDGYTYQWIHNGRAISGATGSSYSIEKIKAADAGTYYCVVSNPVSSTNSSEASLTVNKCAQFIDFPELAPMTFGDADFTLPAKTDKGLYIGYQSTNKSVAIVRGNVLTIAGVGETNIIASQAGSADYLPATTITRKLVVNKISQTITFEELPVKTYEDIPFTLNATSSQGLPITYESVNTEVATINGSTVTIVGAGTTEIIASQPGNATHHAAASVSRVLTVNKQNQSISITPFGEKVFGDAPIELNKTSNKGLEVAYSSSDESVATVVGNIITIKHPGTTVITGIQSGTKNYLPAETVQQTLTVSKAPQTIHLDNIAPLKYGDADIILPASTDKGLAIVYSSDNDDVATIINGNTLHITGAGSTNITARQEGNEYYHAASDVTVSFSVEKAYQTINFPELALYVYGAEPIELNATTNSSSPIRYESSNSNVAQVVDNILTIIGAGTCYITAYADGDNNYYGATPVQRQLVVEKGSQTLSMDAIEDKVYGDAPITLNATSNRDLPISFSSSNPRIISINGSQAVIRGAGSVVITATQSGTDNYEGAETSISVKVNKAMLVAAAENKERFYGDENPELTISYKGFKNGDSKEDLLTEPVALCQAKAISPVGTYDITIEEVTDNNYTFQYQKGQMIVAKAPLTIRPNDAEKEYGEKNPDFSLTYTGFKNDETIAVFINHPVVYTTAKTMSDVGTYPIYAEGGEIRNYSLKYEEGALTITKAPLSIHLSNCEREYGLDNEYTITYKGFKGDDSKSDLDVLPTVITKADKYSDVGEYDMSLMGGNDNNYDYLFEYENKSSASINIIKVSLWVIADDKEYYKIGGTFPLFSMSFEGFRNGDSKDDIDEWPRIYCNADKTYPAGEYDIYLTGGYDNNYHLQLKNGTLTIIEGEDGGIEDVTADTNPDSYRVYTITGLYIKTLSREDLKNVKDLLAPGVYVIGNRKVLIK